MKRLAGRTDIEDALQRLDALTKEEGLMTSARNLEVTHQVGLDVKVVEGVARNVDDNVKATKECTWCSLTVSFVSNFSLF
jgi:hypothetical protein